MQALLDIGAWEVAGLLLERLSYRFWYYDVHSDSIVGIRILPEFLTTLSGNAIPYGNAILASARRIAFQNFPNLTSLTTHSSVGCTASHWYFRWEWLTPGALTMVLERVSESARARKSAFPVTPKWPPMSFGRLRAATC